jgi:hypothetical protein
VRKVLMTVCKHVTPIFGNEWQDTRLIINGRSRKHGERGRSQFGKESIDCFSPSALQCSYDNSTNPTGIWSIKLFFAAWQQSMTYAPNFDTLNTSSDPNTYFARQKKAIAATTMPRPANLYTLFEMR